jgi:hypothetical protein
MPERKKPKHARGRHAAPRASFRRRRIVLGILGLFAIFLVWLTISLGMALTNQSYGASLSARFAEWGRDHGIGGVVTWAEQQWYALNPPKQGGKPPADAFKAKGDGAAKVTSTCPDALGAPTDVPTPAQPPQPNEGHWQPVGRLVANCAAVYETFVRPDTVHTSYVVGLAWMDPKLLSAALYSGSQIPGGGPFSRTAPVKPDAASSLVAAFNAGFRMQDSLGGYYTDAKTVIPLVDGKASAVIYKDGTMDVGSWGKEVKMTPEVESVRQNLDLIVDNAEPVAGLNASDNTRWGATLGGSALVWRSGMGVKRNGAIVYAGGPSLTITALADLLSRAGCIRAMELDINTDWVNFVTFAPAAGQPAAPSNASLLLSNMSGGTSRYFATWWTRDFFTMSTRFAADAKTTVTTTTTSPTSQTSTTRAR